MVHLAGLVGCGTEGWEGERMGQGEKLPLKGTLSPTSPNTLPHSCIPDACISPQGRVHRSSWQQGHWLVLQLVEASARGLPGSLPQPREVSQKPPGTQPAKGKCEARGITLRRAQPTQWQPALKGWERAMVNEGLTVLCFLPSAHTHRHPSERVTSDVQPGG